jgi:hypothetical protein
MVFRGLRGCEIGWGGGKDEGELGSMDKTKVTLDKELEREWLESDGAFQLSWI